MCISKGKAHKRYEFGCKVGIAATNREGLFIAAMAFEGNPYDGHTLKATAAKTEEMTGVEIKRLYADVYTIFDEFSVFAGEQVLNLINQGRGAGVHAVLATQSVADIGRAVTNGPDHFINQVFGSCNSYLIHRLNAADDVSTIVETIGTKDKVEHTAQVDMLGSTGLGSARQTKTFQVHPDEIKQLATGEAVFVNKNNNGLHHLLVRHSRIDRPSS